MRLLDGDTILIVIVEKSGPRKSEWMLRTPHTLICIKLKSHKIKGGAHIYHHKF